MNLRLEPGFLNTGASLAADLSLLAYILLILPAMIAGFVFARRKMYEPQHKFVMTGITLFNWVLIILLMALSYSDAVAPNVPDNLSENRFLLPVLHLITGGIAQLLATYLVIRMWFENSLPSWFKIKNIKLPMRITLTLWTVTVLLGISIYFTWYGGSTASAGDGPVPAATEEPSTGNGAPAATQEEAPVDETPEPASIEETATEEVTAGETPEPSNTEDVSAGEAPPPTGTEEAAP